MAIKNFIYFICAALAFLTLQSFLNTTKRHVRKSFQNYITENNYKATILETDTTIQFELKDASVKPFKEIVYFKHGICFKDANYYSCDSCMRKKLIPILENKKWKWAKISDTKYISKRKYLLEIISDGTNFSYILQKQNK